MRHFVFTFIALLMAGTAMADSYLFVDDFTVSPNQQTVTVPVKAHFNARVSGFQLDVTYPEGLTPVEVENGADMTISYVDIDGADRTEELSIFMPNSNYTRFMGAFLINGYWDSDGDGTYERYGVIKWEAGDYEEMFFLTLNIDEGFQGGEIVVETEVGAGDDARGGTVCDLGEDLQIYTRVCNVSIQIQTPAPEITAEDMGGYIQVTAIGEGDVHLYLQGEEVENPYYVNKTFEAQMFEFTATAQAEGQLLSDTTPFTLTVPPLEKEDVPAPVISYEINDTHVIFTIEWPESDGERVFIENGNQWNSAGNDDDVWNCRFARTNEGMTYEVEAYVREGYAFKESDHAAMTVVVPPIDPETPVTDYSLTIADGEVLHGRTIVIPVSMTNAGPVIAFQTDLYLPEGFELQSVELTNRKVDHTLSWNAMADGSVRILSYSPSLLQFNGTDGEIFNITVKVPDDAAGDYPLYLKNSLVSIHQGNDYIEVRCDNASSNLNVWAFIPGDANGDGVVDVADVVATAQYILGQNPNPFVFEAADMNHDGVITVTDAVLITREALNPNLIDLLCAPARGENNDAMSAEGLCLSAGETRTVVIALDNDVDYTAFQLDVQLPAGLTASNYRVTDRAGSHAFSTSQVDGKQRVMCYSPALETIAGHEGALLTFDVTATGAVSGDITVDGIEMVTAACGTVYLDSFAIGVNSDGISAVKEIAGDLRIYADGSDIIVESPVNQQVVISDIAGHAYSVDVTEGRNVIPARTSGVILVTAGNKTVKLMVK